jgi:hypothetical protein
MPDLLNTIRLSNPYTSAPQLPANVIVEVQVDVGNWTFKGVPRHVEKAIRVAYTYTDDAGVLVQDYLLIGYEGGGAY